MCQKYACYVVAPAETAYRTHRRSVQMPAEQVEEDVSKGNLGTGFEQAQGVMNQEVKYLLETTAKVRKDQNPAWQPNKVWTEANDYVTKLPFATSAAINQMRGLMADSQMTSIEVALLGNLLPDNVDECHTLVPTTADEGRFTDDQLSDILEQLSKYQNLRGG
ncbi:hypothetical protein WJX73_000010 [Symbiochloris irregularis]|uniref:RNA polymerase Rpb4/RPC9 core domain-containing protein n=1 Tax=Symbiochloris irregularis TaxID=706552 RepID=A0AAW1NTZ2_9CHLO